MPNEASFKLRSDLAIEATEESGSLLYVVKDPRSGRFFRIRPLEHFLITQFDGRNSLDDIRRIASEEKKILVSEDVLVRFATKFRNAGLFDAGVSEPTAPTTSIFSIKFRLPQAERLIDWLYPKVRLTCSAPFVVLIGITLLLACAVVVESRHQLSFGFAEVLTAHGILSVLVTISAVTVFHELAHAVVCRHFGGRVTDMGFLLLYFFPCFYVNVSDAYLFRDKRARLWVLFAGAYFELFIWAASVLAWRLVSPETSWSRVFFIIVAVCAVRTFFNLNPLIRMDGYFMLADIVGVANLRSRSFGALTRLSRRILALDTAVPNDDNAAVPNVDLRERRIGGLRGDVFVAGFGVAAVLYTTALVGYVVLHSGSWVFVRFGADSLPLFALVLVGLLHKPALSAAETAKDVSKEKWTQLGGARKRLRFLLLWGVPALLIAFCPWQLRITSELIVLPQQRESVRAPADGRIARIHVQEGARVEAGTLLLEYDTEQLQLERKTKQASLAQANEELRLLGKPSPAFQEQIRVHERALDTARAREQAAREELERFRELWSNGLIADDAFERSENELEQASAERAEAQARIELARIESPRRRIEQMEVSHLKDPNAQRAAIEKLEREIDQIDEVLSRSRVYASIAGTLTTYRFEEMVGSFLEEGALVCEIVDDERVIAEMPVAEKDIDVVELGQEVKFKVRGYPGTRFHATVDAIAPVARSTGETSTILLRAGVDNDDGSLKAGMTGVAKIYAGTSFVAHIWTRDIIRFIRTEFWL